MKTTHRSNWIGRSILAVVAALVGFSLAPIMHEGHVEQCDIVRVKCVRPPEILICEITAYSPTVAECDASPTITASGKQVYVGGIAADLEVLPFGSIVRIPGYNNGDPCVVIDTGGAIQGNKLDVFFWTADEARHWGRRRNVPVTILYRPEAK